MTRRKNPGAELKEASIQDAIQKIKSKVYKSAHHAAKETGIARSILYDRLSGKPPRNKAHEKQQLLIDGEETELVDWITLLTRVNYPPRHSIVREMAQHIIARRVRAQNEESMERVDIPQIGEQWVTRFMRRHPELECTVPSVIEASRDKDTTPEALHHWFKAVKAAIDEYSILPKDIYNMDESGYSIGVVEASKVIINKTIREQYQAQPGRQEWVTSVECICADGTAVPPLIIFRAENLSTQWVPANLHDNWRLSCNSKGWTSNQHGVEWLRRCFEPETRVKANNRYRLLINDGHDSHITGDWLAHCLENKIIPAVLPPHSSHLTQPLDVGVFGPLKKVMAAKIAPLIHTQVHRIQKEGEWFQAFVLAHDEVFNSTNIQSAFAGAGLVPFRPSKVLRRFEPQMSTPPPVTPSPLTTPTPFTSAVLTSSPVDMNAVQVANRALNEIVAAKQAIPTPARNYKR
jgi:hypothetical protein